MSKLECPRCGQTLLKKHEGCIEVSVCPSCAGMWAKPALTRQMAQLLEVAKAARRIAEDADQRAPFGGSVGNVDIPCPVCSRVMARLLFENAQVVLDTCNEHGTWFDRGEMQRMVDQLDDISQRDGGPYRSALGSIPPPVQLPPAPQSPRTSRFASLPPIAEHPTPSPAEQKGPAYRQVLAALAAFLDD
jgi:Zn-finger nucleic acid-binding protein